MLPRPLCTLVMALWLLPAVARADIGPTEPGTTDATGTTGTTGSSSDGATEPQTMPPKYEPCGCRSDELGGGASLLVAALAVWALRRRSAR